MRSSIHTNLTHSTFNPQSSQSPLIKQINHSQISTNQSVIKNKSHKSKTQIFKQCQLVLRKSAQLRTPTDNQALISLIDHNQFLSDMTAHVGMDCYKGLMKNAKIQEVRAKQIIRNQNDPITHIVIVLDGKLGICKQQDDFKIPKIDKMEKGMKVPPSKETKTIITMQNLFDQLTALSCKQIQIIRKKNLNLKRKSSLPLSAGMFMPPPCTNQQFQALQIQSIVNSNEEYGSKLRCTKKIHPNAVVTLQKSLLLTFQFSFLVYWFELAFRAKLGKTIEMMKKLSAFSFLQDGKLAQIILYMRKQKRRRNEPVYREGQRTQYLFMLIDGEIKFSKQANLFLQNPNELYMDRRKLIKQNSSQQKKIQKLEKAQQDILPYANLTNLYNYRPVKKTIQLGITSSTPQNLCFFGAEEVISKKNRETTALVSSFDAQYYLIEVKKLDQVLGSKFIQQFYQLLEQSLRKAILYRQNEFAQKINLQNTKNLDYFYYQGNKVKDSPRKYRLQKINDLFSQQKKQQNNVQSSKKFQPFYTTFNFDKLAKGQNHMRHLSQRKVQNKSKDSRPETAVDSSHESLKVKYNADQQKLIAMSHSWKPIKLKVGQQMKVSKKISQKKHQINLFQPLIDQEYFAFVQKQQRRINREHKIFKLSLGKRSK